MRRLGIPWVVLLTSGILVVGLAGGATPHPARARTVDAMALPVTPASGPTEQPPTVAEAPAITSAGAVSFPLGTAGAFTVITTGSPAPGISQTGTLPSGVSFADNGDGTATLSGTPDPGTAGTYRLTISASNEVPPDATQSFTLTVTVPASPRAPAITSAGAVSFPLGTAGAFTVTTTGSPAPGISQTGTLPSGVSFADNGDGTATLSGTPDPGTAGTYRLTISASNGIPPDATQSFTLTAVTPPPKTPTPSLTPGTPAPSPTSQPSSRAALWWLAALAAIGVLVAVITGAVVIRRVRRHRAIARERISATPHPDAGTVNLDRSEAALAHTVRLEPHADRGTPYLEDEP
jgi:hypothetical protein